MKNTENNLCYPKYEAVSMHLHLIDWKRVIKNVNRMRARIAKAKARGNRRSAKFLIHLLGTSPSIRLLKLRQESRRARKHR
jgi:hypothetical protein